MNHQTKMQLKDAATSLEQTLRVIADACEIEKDAFDHLPRSFQTSDLGCEKQTELVKLESARHSVKFTLGLLQDLTT